MTDTAKYELEEISYGVSGWNGVATSNFQALDDFLHTYRLGTLGESVSQYDAVYLNTDGKWYKALANITKQPALGLAIEVGIADDEIRIQRIGPITNGAWSWSVALPVYLSPSTPGGLTQTAPGSDVRQLIGEAETATKIFIDIEKKYELYLGNTTTTSSTTTTTTA